MPKTCSTKSMMKQKHHRTNLSTKKEPVCSIVHQIAVMLGFATQSSHTLNHNNVLIEEGCH